MEKIWEFFERMEEPVYVSDTESHEVVYMNKKGLATCGFSSPDEVLGKKCYEILQHCAAPCAACNNDELRPGEFKEWSYYNPLLDRQFKHKATLLEEAGKRYRMELAVDIGSQEPRGGAAQNYRSLEAMINEGLRVALQEKTPSDTIEVLLEYLGKALRGERTYIFERNEKGGDDNTYEWAANGVRPEKENLQDLPPEVCAKWYERFRTDRHIVIKDLEDIRKRDPLQYEILKNQKIHSLVVVPLYDDGEAIGFYGVDNPPGKALDYTSNMLQIMAHFIVSLLKQRNLVRELQRMSYCDQLTKVGNRHAMEEFIEQSRRGQSVGLIFCDVTGLKQVNDREGHKAGDRLLITACGCMRQALGEYGLFRIGGDEFLAICTPIDEALFWEKTELLKRLLRDASVQMAVGAVWEKEGRSEIDRLMTAAERRMYSDKAEYYQQCGIDRRSC